MGPVDMKIKCSWGRVVAVCGSCREVGIMAGIMTGIAAGIVECIMGIAVGTACSPLTVPAICGKTADIWDICSPVCTPVCFVVCGEFRYKFKFLVASGTMMSISDNI